MDTKLVQEWVVSEDKLRGRPRKRQRMEEGGIYLAPMLNLPPRGAYSDAKQVVQQLNLLNARGANMVKYGTLHTVRASLIHPRFLRGHSGRPGERTECRNLPLGKTRPCVSTM